MAHTCPDCGSLCHCSGDWDDLDFGIKLNCKHYLSENCEAYSDDDDESGGDPGDILDIPPSIFDDPNQLSLFETKNLCQNESIQKRAMMHIVR